MATACLWTTSLATGLAAAPPELPDLPDPGGVVAGYQQVREWVSRFDLPRAEDAEARIRIEHATAACVLLRHNGRLVGTGHDTTADALMLRRAAGRALGRVLSHPALARLTERLRREDEPGLDVEDLRRSLGRTLTLEIEVAGAFVPLLGRSYDQIARQVEPGLDGVAMRRGQDWAMLFPARLRATNRAADLRAALPTLATELSLAAAPLDELIRRHDVALYRFRTTHLAQATPQGRPFATYRGRELVRMDEVSVATVAALADGIAGRLVDTLWPAAAPEWVDGTYEKPPGVMGDYHPVADEYAPVSAPPLAQALASFALSSYAIAPGVDPAVAQRADGAAVVILHDLAEWADREPAILSDPDVAAAITFAFSARPEGSRRTDPLLQSLHRRAAASLIDGASNDAARLRSAHGQALVAGGLARLLVTGGGESETSPAPPDPQLVRRMVDFAWRATPTSQHVALLPWVAWAESDLAAAGGTPIANAGAIRRIRELLYLSQVGAPERPGPDDLHGGFALRRGDWSPVDAQTTRPMITLGWMLHEPALTTDAERDLAMDRQRRAARFLMQLVASESSLWAYRHAERVRGGVFAATWDADQPVLAQAMGLLAACETVRGLSFAPNPEPEGAGGVQNTVENTDG